MLIASVVSVYFYDDYHYLKQSDYLRFSVGGIKYYILSSTPKNILFLESTKHNVICDDSSKWSSKKFKKIIHMFVRSLFQFINCEGEIHPNLTEIVEDLDIKIINETEIEKNSFYYDQFDSTCKDLKNNQIITQMNETESFVVKTSGSIFKTLVNTENYDDSEDMAESLISRYKLIYLELSNNQYIKIEQTTFSKFKKLRYLHLHKNLCLEIEQHTFNEFNELEILYMSENNLRVLPDKLFDKLEKLKILDLSKNMLSAINSTAFNNLKSLECLHLNDNQLKTLPINIFNNLDKLIYLSIANNNFSDNTLALNLLHNLNQLQVLFFNMNYQNSIQLTNRSMANLSAIIYIDISSNGLTLLPANIFSDSINLEYVDMSNNSLTTLPPGIFNNCTALRMIMLHNNNINQLPHHAFIGPEDLRFLDLSQNNFHTLEAE